MLLACSLSFALALLSGIILLFLLNKQIQNPFKIALVFQTYST